MKPTSSGPTRARALRSGVVAKSVVALGLALSLGGYAVAESSVQHGGLVAERAAAERTRDAVAAERARAVATGRDAVADAVAVQTVAAGSVPVAELAPLTTAVARLTALIAQVPTGAGPGATETSAEPATADPAYVAGVERSSRAVAPSVAEGTVEASPSTGPSASIERSPSAAAEPSPEPLPEPSPEPLPEPSPQPQAAPVAASPGPTSPSASPSTSLSPSPSATDSSTSNAPHDAADDVSGADADSADADDDAANDAVAARILVAAARVADLTARVKTTSAASAAAAVEAAATTAQAAQADAEAARQAAQRASLAAYANGRVPTDALCPLEWAPGHVLRCDATEALARLDESFRTVFGEHLVVTDSYRSYRAQVACARTKGRLCAPPGTSNHGRGVAVDLGGGVERFGSAQHAWMVEHAVEFDWTLPAWASRSGSKSEPWHWEFTG